MGQIANHQSLAFSEHAVNSRKQFRSSTWNEDYTNERKSRNSNHSETKRRVSEDQILCFWGGGGGYDRQRMPVIRITAIALASDSVITIARFRPNFGAEVSKTWLRPSASSGKSRKTAFSRKDVSSSNFGRHKYSRSSFESDPCGSEGNSNPYLGNGKNQPQVFLTEVFLTTPGIMDVHAFGLKMSVLECCFFHGSEGLTEAFDPGHLPETTRA